MTQLNLLIVTKLKFTKISPAILLRLVLVNSILSPPWNEAQAFVGETVDSKTDSSDSEFRFNQGENDNNDGNQIKATGEKLPLPSDEANQASADTLDGRDGRELLLRRFRPKSQLKVTRELKESAKYHVVDVHTHFRYKLRQSEQAA